MSFKTFWNWLTVDEEKEQLKESNDFCTQELTKNSETMFLLKKYLNSSESSELELSKQYLKIKTDFETQYDKDTQLIKELNQNCIDLEQENEASQIELSMSEELVDELYSQIDLLHELLIMWEETKTITVPKHLAKRLKK